MNEYMELLKKPFLKNKEIAQLLGVSPSTVCKFTKDKGLVKYPWGYSTDEIIDKLNLKKFVKRQEKQLKKADSQMNQHTQN